MKKILITGGTGYVGAMFTPCLFKEVIVPVLDLMIYGENILENHLKLTITYWRK